MKQKTFLIAALFLLAPFSIYFGFFRNRNTYNEKMEIDLRDTNQISEIRIEQANKVVNLSKIANKWLVDDVYNANEFEIKQLFRIFINLEINILLPENKHDSVVNLLNKNGIRLSFFIDKKLKSSYCIGNYDDIQKSTVLMTEKELPVYVTAPGLATDIRKFVEADAIFWRNKRIFDFEPLEINSINLYDYKKPDNSFQIEIKDSEFQVFDQKHKPYQFDIEQVSRYLSYFENIEFESVANDFSIEKTDSILNQQANYLIKVKSISGSEFELKILPISIPNESNKFDLNKAYGVLNNRQPIVLINYFAIDPIIKEISYFKNTNSIK